MSGLRPLLLDKDQARQLFAGMPERSFMSLARNHAIKIGTAYYWRPEDLQDIVKSLPVGAQS